MQGLILDTLIVAFFWYIAIYSLKMENIERISTWEEHPRIAKWLLIVSKLFVGLVIVSEAGEIFMKKTDFFSMVNTFFELPFVSHLLYMSVFMILFHACMQMTRRVMDTERYMLKLQLKAISSVNALVMTAIMIIIYFVNSIFWGEFRLIYSKNGIYDLQNEVLLGAVFILLPAVLILINSYRYINQVKIRLVGFRISLPIILLLACSKMILVKLFVIYDLLIWLLHRIDFVSKPEKFYENKLLIPSTLARGSSIGKMNAYFVTSYFLVFLMLWSLQTHPIIMRNELYQGGIQLAANFSLAFFMFWMIELMSRRIHFVGNYTRIVVIPFMILFTINPFMKGYSNVILIGKNIQLKSIYHQMNNAFGDNSLFFFVCLILMQCILAYILHIITGEIHNDRHYYSVLPVVFIVQVSLLAVLYPTFLNLPPLKLLHGKTLFIMGMILAGFLLTFLIGFISYYLFTSRKSDWSRYMASYWKVKTRVFLLVGFMTLINILPLFFVVAYPIHNRGVEEAWTESLIPEGSAQKVVSMAIVEGQNTAYILTTDGIGKSGLIAFAIESGAPIWDMEFSGVYDRYKIWNNQQIVLVRQENDGAKVIQLNDGSTVYETTIPNASIQEFINIEVNERAILVTNDEGQYVYDVQYGELLLDTLGNNFYSLVPGNQCALIKNHKLYQYKNDRFEKNNAFTTLKDAAHIYYDDYGLILYEGDQLVRFLPDLVTQDEKNFEIINQKYLIPLPDPFSQDNNSFTLYFEKNDRRIAYVVNTVNFDIETIPLEQKIQEKHDIQNLQMSALEGTYLLYDEYQISMIQSDRLIAREWFMTGDGKDNKLNQEITAVGKPIILNNHIIWAEESGRIHCVRVQE